MKIYKGSHVDGFGVVEVLCPRSPNRRAICGGDGGDMVRYFLRSRMDLRYSSPGFDWGRPGLMAAQCALALLCDALGDEIALGVQMEFLVEVVHELPDRWEMSDDEIFAWYQDFKVRLQDASLELETCS